MSPHLTNESSLDRRVVTRPFCRHSAQSILSHHSARIALSQSLRLLASLEHDVIPRRHSSLRPTSRHSTVLSSLGAERSLAFAPFSYSLRVASIRFKLSIKTSPNPTDESSSRLFTSLLIVLGSNR
ncbi:hypothetical protein HID58_082132 [Brassica napus]|uniref:Uncharacterized protein n=1 Tax=Brassica napus TaxID=3708 RepID=A0ABQ7Y9N8_BRANA|nr:hypothetical protein HID58_082132 [Brassica napus]